MNNIELAKCPRCRVKDIPRFKIVDPFYGWIRIECRCGNCTAVYNTKEEAIIEWNKQKGIQNVD